MVDNRDLLRRVINDICYTQGLPNDKKAASMMSFAEIIIQRLLRNQNSSNFNLRKSIDYLKQHGYNKRLLKGAETIRLLCDEHISTASYGNGITDGDVERCEDAILDLYAGLFIDFFARHPIGENSRPILYMFSFLPPIIRWKTLTDLWDDDKTNRYITDKLCLAILKTNGKASAASWVEEHKEELESVIAAGGSHTAWMMFPGVPKNMYELCREKVEDVGRRIERDGLAYQTLEEAKYHYDNCMKNINLVDDAQLEFKEIMDFCFENRKEIIKDNAGKWLIVKEGIDGKKEVLNTINVAGAFKDGKYKA